MYTHVHPTPLTLTQTPHAELVKQTMKLKAPRILQTRTGFTKPERGVCLLGVVVEVEVVVVVWVVQNATNKTISLKKK